MDGQSRPVIRKWSKAHIQKHAWFLIIKLAGGRKAFAIFLGVPLKTLNSWLQVEDEVKGMPIPYRMVLKAARLTGVSIERLAPFDIEANANVRAIENKGQVLFVEQSMDSIIVPEITCESFIHNPSILITNQCVLIAGLARVEACKTAGMQTVGVTEINLHALLNEPRSFREIDDRFVLREKVAISVGLEHLLEDEPQLFLEAMKANSASVCRSSDTSVKRTAAFMAKICGLGSKDTFYRARQICFQGILELVLAVERKQIPIATAAQIAKLPKPEQGERLKQLEPLACSSSMETNF